MKLLVKFVIAVVVLLTIVYWINWTIYMEEKELIFLQQMFEESDYILSPPKYICTRKPLYITLITSYVGHTELRLAHRQAQQQNSHMFVVRVFLLAQIPDTDKTITQLDIDMEHDKYGDILQGGFVENYRNLTRKHLMGLQWAAGHCGEAKFILKIDDDTVYDFYKTQKFIDRLYGTGLHKDRFLMGYMLNNTLPKRKPDNKWFVTHEEYPFAQYPAYLSGWFYVTTPATAALLSAQAAFHRSFWIDDVFVTGVLATALHIKLRHLPEGFWLEYYELLECCMRDMKAYKTCDFVVGPNGGRNNLIVEFNRIKAECESKCHIVTKSEDLKKNCIVLADREIFGTGHHIVQSVLL